MNTFVKENLNGIRDLFYTGLDFVVKNHPQHLEEYILINRQTFAQVDIPLFIYDEWVTEWRAKA